MSRRAQTAFVAGAIAYALVAIFTFGHCAGHHPVKPGCLAYVREERRCIRDDFDPTPMSAGLAAILWPFYWSWELQA